MSEKDEIKTWQTQSYKKKVALYLIVDGVSFSFNEEDGIVFAAPEFYIKKMQRQLVMIYDCPTKPVINEVK